LKHFVIIDDESAEAKALIAQAKKLLGVRIITELELEQLEDTFMADAIDRGLRSEVSEMEEIYRILDRKDRP
jgi:hypothetical protein